MYIYIYDERYSVIGNLPEASNTDTRAVST